MTDDYQLSPADERELRRMVREMTAEGDDFERGWRLCKQISDEARSELLQEHANRLNGRDRMIRDLTWEVWRWRLSAIAVALVASGLILWWRR